jgi:hypothetical protein
VSSESIVSHHTPAGAPEAAGAPKPVGAPEVCRGCAASLADDQRYCLECGERRTPMSSVLLGGPPAGAADQRTPRRPPDVPSATSGTDAGRGAAATVIAGVGVLLLAMGVGVLIGRSGGGGKQASTPPPQVISVSSATGSGASTGASETTQRLEQGPGASKAREGRKRSKASSGNRAGAGGSGASEKHPAPPSAANGLNKAKGKNYEEKSKNLPDVISTG